MFPLNKSWLAIFCRYHRNLSANTVIFVGTVPLAVYHAPSAPPMDGERKAPEVGFVIPSANTALPPLPESNLYPNLRKFCTIISVVAQLSVSVSPYKRLNLPRQWDEIESIFTPRETIVLHRDNSFAETIVFNFFFSSAPPSFEESTYGAKNLRERGESEHVYGLDNHFAPRYPVYNFAPAQ